VSEREDGPLRFWGEEAALWQHELCFGDVEGTLRPEELAALERMFGSEWRDWTREELFVAAIDWFAQTIAYGVLGTGAPLWLFRRRVHELRAGSGGRTR
jgi:hypothetical protein